MFSSLMVPILQLLNTLGLLGSSPLPPSSRFLRLLPTEAASLHRLYLVSAVLLPSRHLIRPGLVLPGYRLIATAITAEASRVSPGLPLSACCHQYPGSDRRGCSLVTPPLASAFPVLSAGRLLPRLFRGLHGVYTTLRPARLAKSPYSDPLHRRLRHLRYLQYRSDCFRVEQTSSRAGLSTRG
jgi:hypothetical protein